MRNFHVPLPEDLYDELADEAKLAGWPATAVARHAIEVWLRQGRKSRLREAVASYASRAAGSGADLDTTLEAAGIESLRSSEE